MIKHCLKIITIAACSLSYNAFGSDKTDAAEALQTVLRGINTYMADFNQTVVDAQGNEVHQAEGKISMAQPNLLRWHTTAPDEILLVADGDAVWQIDYFVEQVSVVDQQTAMQNNPMMLLTSNNADDWHAFDISRVDNGFSITAKERSQIMSLTLVLNDQNRITSLKSLDAQGQTSMLAFTNVRQNVPLGDANTFILTVPEGFYLDDQRQPGV
ncbi:outer membrane lipoprotein chaperone LolA [Alteromonas oceanisediminis]|uniref:outer membrane lipoprotein chaperone LolA n=1 Tax=Alteromonas oceanisediminis TaxID=2836180 RepID=UPI001BDB4330|nr:outer membrane lipoprotein chaperone LolA [Alteromonas oceanisediminis]MBT0586345.1 outer membrane lipoprotein chaperone LolA [Alteromonas oceanisediminis]